MCKQNREFFQLPDHVKRSVAHPPRANPNRGWVCAGQERSDNITDFEKGVKERVNKDGIFDLKVSLLSHGGVKIHGSVGLPLFSLHYLYPCTPRRHHPSLPLLLPSF